MRAMSVFLMAALLSLSTVMVSPAQATSNLFEWAVHVDGVISNVTQGDPLPSGVNVSAFDSTLGLGMLSATVTGAGPHYVALFVDHEIDEPINTFFNEYGAVSGLPLAGQSWEVDEPGYIFGDIYDNFMLGALDNSNSIPMGSPDDVSMALGWEFSLDGGETGLVSFGIEDTAPGGGFYLYQVDPESGQDIYFASSLTIRSQPSVPAPGAVVLGTLGAGLVGWLRRRRSL